MEKEKYVRKITITGTLVDAYKMYRKANKKSVIDHKKYIEICHLFNKIVSDKIIRESMEFKIPHGLGTMRIKSVKHTFKTVDGKLDKRRSGVDWKKTKDMYSQMYGTNDWDELKDIPNKKVVIYTNEHSNGYTMKWYWARKNSCIFTNRLMYSVKVIKGGITPDGYYVGRRGLAAWIKNEERTNEYYL